MLLVMDEVSILDGLQARSLQHRIEALEELRSHVRKQGEAGGKLVFSRLSHLIDVLNGALGDRQWSVRHQCVQLVCEILPCLTGNEVESLASRLVTNLVNNAFDGKVAIRKAASQALQLYVKQSSSVLNAKIAVVQAFFTGVRDEERFRSSAPVLLCQLVANDANEDHYPLVEVLTDEDVVEVNRQLATTCLCHMKQWYGVERYLSCINRLPPKRQRYYRAYLGGEAETTVNCGRVNGYATRHNSVESEEEECVEFGFVPPLTMEKLRDGVQWRRRVEGIAELAGLIDRLEDTRVLTPHLASLVNFLLPLLDDSNFKVNLITLDIVEHLISKVSLGLKSVLDRLVIGLSKKLGDNKIVREADMRVLTRLMQAVTPRPVLDALLPSLRHKSSRVREETLNVIISALLTYPRYEFDLSAIVQSTAPALIDHKQRVRQAGLELFAVLASSLGSGNLTPLVAAVTQVERVFEIQMGGIGGQAGVMAAVQARLARRQLPRINAEGLVEHANPVPISSASSTASHRPSVTGADIDWILAAPGMTVLPGGHKSDCDVSAISTPTRLPSMNPVSAGPTPRRYCSAGKSRLPWEPEDGKKHGSASLTHVKGKLPPPPIKPRKSWQEKDQTGEGSKISLTSVVGTVPPGSYAELHMNKLKQSTSALSDSAVTGSVSLQNNSNALPSRELSPLVVLASDGKRRLSSLPTREDKPPLPMGLKPMATVPSTTKFFTSVNQQEKELLLSDRSNLSQSWPRQKVLVSSRGKDEPGRWESQQANPLPLKPTLARPGSKKKKGDGTPNPKRVKDQSPSPVDDERLTIMNKASGRQRDEFLSNSSSESGEPSDLDKTEDQLKTGLNEEQSTKPDILGKQEVDKDVCQRPVMVRTVRTPRSKGLTTGKGETAKRTAAHLPGLHKLEKSSPEDVASMLTKQDLLSRKPTQLRHHRSQSPEQGETVLSESVWKKAFEQSSAPHSGKFQDSKEHKPQGSRDNHDLPLPVQSSVYSMQSLKTVNDSDSVSGHVEVRSVAVKDIVLAESTKRKAEELKVTTHHGMNRTVDEIQNTSRQMRNTPVSSVGTDKQDLKVRNAGPSRKGSNVGMAAIFPRSKLAVENDYTVPVLDTHEQYSRNDTQSKPLSHPASDSVSGGSTENELSLTASSDLTSSASSVRSLEMDSFVEAGITPNEYNPSSLQSLQKRVAVKVLLKKNEPEASLPKTETDSEAEARLKSVGNTLASLGLKDRKIVSDFDQPARTTVNTREEDKDVIPAVQAIDSVKTKASMGDEAQCEVRGPVRGQSDAKETDVAIKSAVHRQQKRRYSGLSDHSEDNALPVTLDVADGKSDDSQHMAGSENMQTVKEAVSINRNDQVVLVGQDQTRMVLVGKQQNVEREESTDKLDKLPVSRAANQVVTPAIQHEDKKVVDSTITKTNEGDSTIHDQQELLYDSSANAVKLKHVDKPVLSASLVSRINSRDKSKRSMKQLPSEKDMNKTDTAAQSKYSEVAIVGHGVQPQGSVEVSKQSLTEKLNKDISRVDKPSDVGISETEVPAGSSFLSKSPSPEDTMKQPPNLQLSASLTRRLTNKSKPPLVRQHRHPSKGDRASPDHTTTPRDKGTPDCDSSTRETPQPVLNPDNSLRDALHYLSSDDWEVKCDGMSLLRRLAAHHSDTLALQLKSVILAVVREVKNLRSQVSRSAIQCLCDLYSSLGKAMDLDLDATVQALLTKGSEASGFIRNDVDRALNMMVNGVTPSRAVATLTTFGISHRNMAVRKTTAQTLYCLVEQVGSDQVVQNSREMFERILPAAIQFTMDGSPEARYYGRAIIKLLAYHTEFERLGPKVLSDKHQRQLQVVTDGLRTKGLGELPSDKSSAKRNRSFTTVNSNSGSRASSGASRVSEQRGKPVVQRRVSLGSEIDKMSGKSVFDSHHAILPSLLKGLASSEWRERFEALTELMQLTLSSPSLVGSNIVRIFDDFVPRLTDSNSKVNVYAVQCFEVMLPNLAPYLESVVSGLIASMSINLASKNSTIQQCAMTIIDNIIQVVDNAALVQPFSSVVQFGNVKSKPIMTKKLATIVGNVYSHHRKLVARHVLPVIWHLLSSTHGGKTVIAMTGEAKVAACKLIHVVFDHMGQALLDQARHLPTREQETLQNLLDTNGPP